MKPIGGAPTLAVDWYADERSVVKLTSGRAPRGPGSAGSFDHVTPVRALYSSPSTTFRGSPLRSFGIRSAMASQ
ncbi:hypothetical protein GCM10009601_02850 [Streptomyces thermospinosisporus]|uniref:Uncharacterized protein n=1 Tax=Streptomyces thermospinosisporus TaxID=161482 RepID=A0ABN1YIC9_9ACTN